ncbi:sporulation protein [Brevibacillus dissolubilis]|uniref:sporulation protein n=1 Tax=Brevibacillus dissolubilis TaxID=1844116 RepID=UPI001115F50B|nr:sporulation protein [Brevibacillus dissolubilis]
MFKKLMAKIGIGAATVDLRLHEDSGRLGETLTGVIHIEGGSVEQPISMLSVQVELRALLKGNKIDRVVETIPVKSGFAVKPAPYVEEVPFSFRLPNDMAISTPYMKYYLHTVLDVEQALDPTDLDPFVVNAPVYIEKVFRSLDRVGFIPKPGSGAMTKYGQEFAFYPPKTISVPLRELEVIFYDAPDAVHLLIEMDVQQGGFFGREVERKAEIILTKRVLEDWTEEEVGHFIQEKVEGYCHNPQTIPYFSMEAFRPGSGHGHVGHGLGNIIGGLAVGLIGTAAMSEILDEADDFLDLDDVLGSDDDGGGDDGGDFGDFGFGD